VGLIKEGYGKVCEAESDEGVGVPDLDPPKRDPRNAPAPALLPFENSSPNLSMFFSSMSSPVAMVELGLADDLVVRSAMLYL